MPLQSHSHLACPTHVNLRLNSFQTALHFCIATSFSHPQFFFRQHFLLPIYIRARLTRFKQLCNFTFHTLFATPLLQCWDIFATFLTNVRHFDRFQTPVQCAFHFISPPTHLPALFAQCSFAGVTLFNPPTYWTWFLPPPTYSPFTMACFCLHHFGTFQITLGIPFHFLASLFLLQGTEKLYPVNYMYLL